MISLLQQNETKQTGVLSKKIVSALVGVVRDVRAAACTTCHQEYQLGLLIGIKAVAVAIRSLLQICRQVEATPNDPRNAQSMLHSDAQITESLNAVVNELPLIKVCDGSFISLKDISKGVSMATLPTVNQPKPYSTYIIDGTYLSCVFLF